MKDTKKGVVSPKLPKQVKVRLSDLFDSWFDDELTEHINNYLFEKYGFCNNGYSYDDTITISDIDWEMEE